MPIKIDFPVGWEMKQCNEWLFTRGFYLTKVAWFKVVKKSFYRLSIPEVEALAALRINNEKPL